MDSVASPEECSALLESLPGNSVIYSEVAWAAARKASQGGAGAAWFVDSGASRGQHFDSSTLAKWTADWRVMVPASPEVSG